MGLYVYAIGRSGHPKPGDVTGVADAPVDSIAAEGFDVWVSELGAAPQPSLEEIRRHNAVVEAATEDHTPLPSRFGQWFADRDQLEESIRNRGERLASALERVAGAIEYGVRILDPDAAVPEPERTSGKAYLEGLARRERERAAGDARAESLGEELREALADTIRAQAVQPLASPDGVATVAHLVDRHETGTYRDRLRAFASRYPDLTFVPTGPWPPYGFADE